MWRALFLACFVSALACSGSSHPGQCTSNCGTDGSSGGGPPPLRPPGENPIPAENARPGTADWRIILVASHEIEGYALRQSAAPGDDVGIAVSVSGGDQSFTWVAYRLGYYGGKGAREVARGGPLAASSQGPCVPDPTTGLVACAWSTTFTLHVGSDWISGGYLVKLVRADGYARYVPLIVRNDATAADVVAIAATATWQAYNRWAGESLYDDDNHITGRGRAFEVSYDRPYLRDRGAGHLLTYDRSLIVWLEAHGVNVAYATDEDVERDPTLLASAKAFVISGHDEYWSSDVRSHADAAVAGGTSLLLFGANSGFWQVRYRAAADGRDRRIITCYKGDAPKLDPVGPQSPLLTVLFRDPPVSRPENALFGVMYDGWNTSGFPHVVANPSHWALAQTGLAQGDTLPQIAGYEVDAIADNGQTPPGVEVLADSPFLDLYGGTSRSQMVIRKQGSAIVFAAGGIDFVRALSGDIADPRVQRIAANVLSRALGAPLPDSVVFGGPPPSSSGPFARSVTTFGGTAGQAVNGGGSDAGRLIAPVAVAPLPGGGLAVADMGANAVRRIDASGMIATVATPPLQTPLGIAADAQGNIYVADSGNACIRRIDAAGNASVLAGVAGSPGSGDGPGNQPRFLVPTGLALANGALYVADVAAGAVRRVDLVDPNHGVTTVPGSTILYRPTAVAVAPDGTVFVVETGASRVVALRGGQLEVIAGGTPGFSDGAAADARFLPQLGIAILRDGSLAVGDPGNYRVRRIASGQVTTLAGSGLFGVRDGPGNVADLVLPTGLAMGSDGTLYVAETGSGTIRAIVP